MLGIPWRHQARDPGQFLDCIGYGRCAVEMATGEDFAEFDRTNYDRNPFHGQLTAILRGIPRLREIPLSDLAPGDLVTLDLKGQTRHLAIVGEHPQGGLSLLHTGVTTMYASEHRLDAKWRRRLREVFRVVA